MVGIAVAVISAVANFMFIPYYPIWAVLLIALDIFVIWAIATVRTGDMLGFDESGATRSGRYAGEAGRTPSERWPAATPADRWEAEPAREDLREGPTRGGQTRTPAGYSEYPQDDAARRAAQEAEQQEQRRTRG
jgi:hypothetical protein